MQKWGDCGFPPNNPDSERVALDSIIARTLLAKAAREAELHRRPEAIAQMHAAQDQALADLYLMVASQPAEPSRQEIEDYITGNPTLFAKRRTYEFSVLTLPTKNFDEETMTPLFDEDATFERLEIALREKGCFILGQQCCSVFCCFPESNP